MNEKKRFLLLTQQMEDLYLQATPNHNSDGADDSDVVRTDSIGDTLWTITLNGLRNGESIFYSTTQLG